MGRQIAWDSVPDTDLVPDDTYHARVEELKEEFSREKGLLMYALRARIIAPKECAGMSLFNRYVVGTEDDPTADDPNTHRNSIGLRQLKRLASSLEVPLSPDLDEVCAAAQNRECLFVTKQKQGNDGVVRSNVTMTYKLGERAVGTNGAKPKARLAATRPQATAPAPTPQPQPTTQEDVVDFVEE